VSAVPAPVLRLGGGELARALTAGIHRLLREQEYLDRINVFPVADGDTGTNLAMTMGTALTALKAAPADHAGRVLATVADAALDGARGNSGAILAQFLLGLADRGAGLAELDAGEFAAALTDGARYAREALAEPREGTILTVLSAVAADLRRGAASGARDLTTMLREALAAGERALVLTEGQLEALTRAHVVDAGAAGFVTLLRGFTDYLVTGDLDESGPRPGGTGAVADAAGDVGSLEHRWCTECMVTAVGIDRRRLREELAAIASSLVVAGSASRVRVHAHVAEPAQLFRIAAAFGTVSAEKADDMQRQQEAALHSARRRVAIVTDTAADIPEDEQERLDIHVVPLRVHFGEHSYLDKVGLAPDEFYRRLATDPQHPKTSRPPAGDFRRMFGFLGSHYAEVVSLNVTGRASGTRQAAESAAARMATPGSVRVIDSLSASAGQGLLAMHAAECALAGLGAEAIEASVRAQMARTRTYALLRSLDYGVRGGRVPAWARTVANALGLSPCLKTFPDGRIGIGGFVRGRRHLAERFARFVMRRLDTARRYRIVVAHGDAEADGQRLLERLVAGHGGIERAWLVPLGTAIGVHGGPGTLVVGFTEVDAAPAATKPAG
jgi:DegV family protein with EDD domain